MKSTSKHRTLKKVFLNVTACLTALVVTGNIIANECEVQLNSFLGTSSTKIVTNLPEGVTEEGYVRYYDSKYSTLAELKAAHAAGNVANIDSATTRLNDAWQAASQDMYSAQQQAGGAQQGAQDAGTQHGTPNNAGGSQNDGGVTDVEFEEVK